MNTVDGMPVALTLGELQLIDWVTSAQGGSMGEEDLGKLMAWMDLRERVWRAIIRLSLAPAGPTDQPEATATLITEPYECAELLALIPTTFRWGTGADVGFSLKEKLAHALWLTPEKQADDDRQAFARLMGTTEESNATRTDTPTNPD